MDTYDFEKIDKAMLAKHLDLFALDQFALGFQAVGCAIALSRGEAVPATYTIGSDQYPATVFVASRTGNALFATLDVVRGAGISVPNVDITARRKYTLRGDGTYRAVGQKHGYLSVGRRRLYMDPSFYRWRIGRVWRNSLIGERTTVFGIYATRRNGTVLRTVGRSDQAYNRR